ncbi:D-Glucuronyl C5-Epimerase [Manis pentadactyla]|nr:D-Glucuronyl C5-Epimerase [Manis pentadactyla]
MWVKIWSHCAATKVQSSNDREVFLKRAMTVGETSFEEHPSGLGLSVHPASLPFPESQQALPPMCSGE